MVNKTELWRWFVCGQHGFDGPLPERSVSLLTHEVDEHPVLDLRVGSNPGAVRKMRRLLDHFRPYIPIYGEGFDVNTKLLDFLALARAREGRLTGRPS